MSGITASTMALRVAYRRLLRPLLFRYAGGDPEAVITADMLPPEIGALMPTRPNGQGGEQLMGLPLREAREIFEREYLVAQLNRFSGNISRTAEFIGMERSALHRKLKSLSIE